MNRTILLSAVIFGFLAVILGAFGAHGLKDMIDAASLESYNTGVRYQMYHALLLLWVGTMTQLSSGQKKWIYYCLGTGTVLFSFSIYLLATNGLTSFDFSSIGFITPIGGSFLIFGWGLLGYRVFRNLV